jgi:hypothetical protein
MTDTLPCTWCVLNKRPFDWCSCLPHSLLSRDTNMVNPIALCAVALSFLAVTKGASDPGDPIVTLDEVGLDLNANARNGKVAAAWWAGWHADLLPLDKVSWRKYTHMTYAFAQVFNLVLS